MVEYYTCTVLFSWSPRSWLKKNEVRWRQSVSRSRQRAFRCWHNEVALTSENLKMWLSHFSVQSGLFQNYIIIIAEKNQINTSDNKNCAEMLALAYIQKCTYTRLLLFLESEDHGKLETSCFIHFFASHLHHKSIFLCYKTGMICTGDLCMTSARNWNNSKVVCLLYLLTLKNNNFNIVFGSKTC